MRRIREVASVREALALERAAGKSIGFVPTMGALHDGHIALVREARSTCDLVVVSIFVNPTQFDRRSDLNSYPRDLERDAEVAAGASVDYLFVPSADEMYPSGYRTYVTVEEIGDLLCGAVRAGHFRGVATVVTKLLGIVAPDVAYFGEKDYQQLVVIRRMVADLNMDVDVVGVPTVREPDGLAISSRNALLTPSEREAASVISRALLISRDLVANGTVEPDAIIERIKRIIGEEPLVRIEYVNVCHLDTLRDVRRVDRKALIAIAAYLGTTRLIDNVVVEPEAPT